LTGNTSNKRAFSAHCFLALCGTCLADGSGQIWWVKVSGLMRGIASKAVTLMN